MLDRFEKMSEMGFKGIISLLNDRTVHFCTFLSNSEQICTKKNPGNSGDYHGSKYFNLYDCKLRWKWTVLIDVIGL